MIRTLLAAVVLTIAVASCDYMFDDYILDIPEFGPGSIHDQTHPLNVTKQLITEGIYEVKQGKELLGDSLVFRWNRNILSIFGKRMGIYSLVSGGSLDSIMVMQGYWREALSDNTGLLSLIAKREEGGMAIMGEEPDCAITWRGTFGYGGGIPSSPIELKLVKRFPKNKAIQKFGVIAHRGGGRTSDKLPVSENTPDMISLAQHFGATGIEIDTRLSKDDSVMIYHDSDLNIRLTKKGPFMGPVQQYTYQQLRTLVRLYHGEVMPTLREMLQYTLDSTDIRFVWIDNKDAVTMEKVIPILMEFNKRAKEIDRNMLTVVGMPNEKMMDAYLAYPGHENVPALCELTVPDVEKVNAWVWGPRWTMGIQTSEVKKIHDQGRFAVLWTLDDPQFMEKFMEEGQFDGILTNYPTLLSYYYYVKMCR